jgi:hypothetical protein
MTDEEEFAARSQLKWTRAGDAGIWLYRRRRMGRVVPDKDYPGMWRSVKIDGILSDVAGAKPTSWERQEKLQRAWLVAGMGPTHSPKMDDEGQPKFGPNGRPMVCCQPNFHNYGNTPAFVQYLDWGFCSDPPPVQPDWRACTRTLINNWADTSGAAKPIEVSPAHELMENPVSPRL